MSTGGMVCCFRLVSPIALTLSRICISGGTIVAGVLGKVWRVMTSAHRPNFSLMKSSIWRSCLIRCRRNMMRTWSVCGVSASVSHIQLQMEHV